MEPVILTVASSVVAGAVCAGVGYFVGRKQQDPVPPVVETPKTNDREIEQLRSEVTQLHTIFSLPQYRNKQTATLYTAVVDEVMPLVEQVLSLKQTQCCVLLDAHGRVLWGDADDERVKMLGSLHARVQLVHPWQKQHRMLEIQTADGEHLSLICIKRGTLTMFLGVITVGLRIPEVQCTQLFYALDGPSGLPQSSKAVRLFGNSLPTHQGLFEQFINSHHFTAVTWWHDQQQVMSCDPYNHIGMLVSWFGVLNQWRALYDRQVLVHLRLSGPHNQMGICWAGETALAIETDAQSTYPFRLIESHCKRLNVNGGAHA